MAEALRLGSKGPAVLNLQTRLKALGYPVEPDGDFGSITREAVMAFQRAQGLDADGIVGRDTWNALYEPNKPSPNPASIEPRWLTLARAELGLKELPGPASEARIENMFTDAGFPGMKEDTAWCAAFVNAMLKRAGIRGTGSLAARSFLDWGAKVTEPRLGDVVVFSRGTNPAFGHVAFFLRKKPNGTLEVLGGNQSDAVTIGAYAESRLLGYRRPARTVETVPAPTMPPDYEPPPGARVPDGYWNDPPPAKPEPTSGAGAIIGTAAATVGGGAVAASQGAPGWVFIAGTVLAAVVVLFILIRHRKGT